MENVQSRWNGWGLPGHNDPLATNEPAWRWLAQAFAMPALLATPARELPDNALPPSQLGLANRERLIALLGTVPLLVLFAVSDYAKSVRSALSVDEPRFSRSVTVVAIVAVAGLVGLAAAQPVLAQAEVHRVRSDAEALFVIDTSRSMLASVDPTGTM